MSMWRVVVANTVNAHDAHARRVHRHQQHRLLRASPPRPLLLHHHRHCHRHRDRHPRLPPSSSSSSTILPRTMKTVQRGSMAPLLHHFDAVHHVAALFDAGCRRTRRHVRRVVDATAGSAIGNAERISPRSRSSQRFFCAARSEQHLHVARVVGRAVAGLRSQCADRPSPPRAPRTCWSGSYPAGTPSAASSRPAPPRSP